VTDDIRRTIVLIHWIFPADLSGTVASDPTLANVTLQPPLPLLVPMSIVAGRMGAQIAATSRCQLTSSSRMAEAGS
jgi:hypothetical protein